MKHLSNWPRKWGPACLIAVAAASLAACAAAGPARVSDGSAPEVKIVQADATTLAATKTKDLPPGYWDEVICRREPVTGTRLSRGRCHSRYDWARMSGAAKETMRDILVMPLPCVDRPAVSAHCGN